MRVHHNGRAIVFAAAAWGAFIALFGLADRCGSRCWRSRSRAPRTRISGIFRGALWNETIPDRLRGRLAGLEMISWSSGPLLGNARAGAGASLFGLRGRRSWSAACWSSPVRRARGRAPAVLELRLESVKLARGRVDDGGRLQNAKRR